MIHALISMLIATAGAADYLTAGEMKTLCEQLTPNIRKCEKLPQPPTISVDNITNKTDEGIDKGHLAKALNSAIAKGKPNIRSKKIAGKEKPNPNLKFVSEISSTTKEELSSKTVTYTLYLTVMDGSNTICDLSGEITKTITIPK